MFLVAIIVSIDVTPNNVSAYFSQIQRIIPKKRFLQRTERRFQCENSQSVFKKGMLPWSIWKNQGVTSILTIIADKCIFSSQKYFCWKKFKAKVTKFNTTGEINDFKVVFLMLFHIPHKNKDWESKILFFQVILFSLKSWLLVKDNVWKRSAFYK